MCRYKGDEEQAVEPLDVREEYVKPPPIDYVPPSGQKCALGPLPDGYPTPVLRFILSHFNIVVAICNTDPAQGKSPTAFPPPPSSSHKILSILYQTPLYQSALLLCIIDAQGASQSRVTRSGCCILALPGYLHPASDTLLAYCVPCSRDTAAMDDIYADCHLDIFNCRLLLLNVAVVIHVIFASILLPALFPLQRPQLHHLKYHRILEPTVPKELSQHSYGISGGENSAATTSRIELDLADLCLQADIFDEVSSYAKRVAFSVRSFELRDCALRPDAPPAWRQIFGQNISATSPRGTNACILTVSGYVV